MLLLNDVPGYFRLKYERFIRSLYTSAYGYDPVVRIQELRDDVAREKQAAQFLRGENVNLNRQAVSDKASYSELFRAHNKAKADLSAVLSAALSFADRAITKSGKGKPITKADLNLLAPLGVTLTLSKKRGK